MLNDFRRPLGDDLSVKTLNWRMWALAAILGVGVIALVTFLAWQPPRPAAASPVPDGLQLLGAAVAPVGAVFTTLGVGVALYVAIRDSRRFAKEERLRHEQDTARRADQARLARVEAHLKNRGDFRRISIVLENLSPLPLFDVEVVVPPSFEDRAITTDPVTPVNTSPNRTVKVVRPEEYFDWYFWCDPAHERDGCDFVAMAFTDAAGVRWKRTSKGQPSLAPDPES